ncbi:hypothetical protein B0H10DRAFT_2211336 [Mycena sp. CBHHK59/15]|nr:hypothetical protein B0H10DRAFT_2211336 [Mycena sp. CBHHK59/15]
MSTGNLVISFDTDEPTEPRSTGMSRFRRDNSRAGDHQPEAVGASSTGAAGLEMLAFRLDPSDCDLGSPASASVLPATPLQPHAARSIEPGPLFTPLRPFYPETPYYTSRPLYYPAFYSPAMAPALPQPEPQLVEVAPQTDVDLRATLALDFAGHIFDGITPDTALGGRQRRKFKWPKGLDVVTEDRILVVLGAIKKAGFPTLGSFLSGLFSNKYNKHPTVYHSIAAFLQAKEHLSEHHPIAIIELIFRHRKSQEYIDGVPLEPNFIIPRYALPPSMRLTGTIPSHCPNTTHNAMINWSLQCMIGRFEKENQELLQPCHGFLRRLDDPPLTWEALLLWSMLRKQETIALHGTAIFTLFTTIAVNRTAREKLDAKAYLLANPDVEDLCEPLDDGLPFTNQSPNTDTPAPAPKDSELPHASLEDTASHSAPPDGEDDPDNVDMPNDEPQIFIDPIGRRDPWQAVTVSILMLLVFRNHFALFFPILIGIFAFTCNAHRDVIALASLCFRRASFGNYSVPPAKRHKKSRAKAAAKPIRNFLNAGDLSEAVGLNITGISSLHERFPGLFGLKKNGQKHRDVKVNDDINRLGTHFRKEHILVWESGHNQPYQVGNKFSEGMNVLKRGTLKTFLD